MARRVRAVVVQEEYRVYSVPPPPPPPKKGGFGGVIFLSLLGFGLYAIAITEPDRRKATPTPRPPITKPAPARPAADNSREWYIPADSDHQCYVDAWLKGPSGKEIKYKSLLDSGAAAKVVLNREQAAELGFAGLSYDYRVNTANGVGKAAKVQLPQFRMGGGRYDDRRYTLADVETWVDYTGALDVLIGAELLKTLNFQIREGSCTVTLPYSSAEAPAPAYEPRPSSSTAQCPESKLSKMRGDKAMSLCESACSTVPWCQRLTSRD
jgi:clan AA aspartic protease (TIGR02281 family)